MPVAFSTRGLVKRYGANTALEGVDLDVEDGQLIGLLGPNGAGKSTLVKIGCGLVSPTSGEATVAGHPAGSPQARSAIGYLAELFRFPGWMEAGEVIELHQQLAHSEGGEAERRRLLDLVGLADVAERRVEAMSKGMQQRLGLAQALVGDPKLLMLDEPTSALDPAGRRAVREILEEIRSRGISVLLNSHLLSEVELVCDRVFILSHGRVVSTGDPKEMVARVGVEIETDGGVRAFPEAARGDVPGIVADLVRNGERVYSVKPATTTLEEVYIATVGEDNE
jgi:ABC-2 type transport system ATP-binding protein